MKYDVNIQGNSELHDFCLKRFVSLIKNVLGRNHVITNSPEYLRHTSFCLLQSMYFMIRELQKAENRK